MTAHDADVVVIGAGAAGAAVSWRLAMAGHSVVCLEQGDWLAQPGAPALRADWERALFREFHPNPNVRRSRHDEPIDDQDTPIKPALFNGVGGSTLRWGAHFPRMRPSDFRVRSLDGVADDWPLRYEDLEPYYDLNDAMMEVSGLVGDPANPPRSPRPNPPLPLGPGGERLARAFDALGWHWWPVDAAITSRAGAAHGACNNCGPCAFGCVHGARRDAANSYWTAALAAGARLTTKVRVRRLTGEKRVDTVEYVDASGETRRISGVVVVLAASGIGTPHLLLASRSAAWPDGMANRSGLVGRRLMHHPTAIVTGVFDDELDGHKGPFACAIVSQEFYETDPGRGAVRGYQMQMLRGQGPAGTALGGYMARLPWGCGHHAHFSRHFRRTISLTVTTEDLPDDRNRVTLSDRLLDSAGLPAPRLTYRVSENTQRLLDHGIDRASAALRKAGAREIAVVPLVAGAGFHLLGTARMGDDPATSVVDRDGCSHEVDNLYVADGSVFVTAAAVNPTSTIQALALRIADAIARRLVGGAP